MPSPEGHVDRAAARSLFKSWSFLLAMLLGVVVRTVGLFRQTLVGDELHAFRFAPEFALPEALYTYHWTSNSPPFHAWVRVLMDLGLQPSETWVRIPVWLTGIAALVLIPYWIAGRFGPKLAIVVAWLLVVSPQMIFYTRFMRPYVPMVLGAAWAIAAFWEWWQEGRDRSGYLYAVLAWVCMWLHPVAAPFVMSPWLFMLGSELRSGGTVWPVPKRWIKVAALQVGLLVALFAPAFSSLFHLAENRRATELSLKVLRQVAVLLTGSESYTVAAIFWALVVVGAISCWRKAPRWAAYLVFVSLIQWASVPILTPAFLGNRAIFARYILMIVVPFMFFVGWALMRCAPNVLGRVRASIAGLFVVALAWSNPLDMGDLLTNPIATRPELLHFPSRENALTYEPPEGYEVLAGGSPGAVIEYPSLPLNRFFQPISDYHASHERPILLSPAYDGMNDPRIGLETIVAGDPEAWLATGARFLVLHKDWSSELGPTMGHRRLRGQNSKGAQASGRQFRQMKRLSDAMIETLAVEWGDPDADGPYVSIWDLDRVRGAQITGL